MCGFFGVVNFKGQLKAEDKVDIKKGIKSIEYRGPDDQTLYLTIISVLVLID